MNQPSTPLRTPHHLLQLDDLELHALDEALQAGLADPAHPVLRDWTDILLPLRRKVVALRDPAGTACEIPASSSKPASQQ